MFDDAGTDFIIQQKADQSNSLREVFRELHELQSVKESLLVGRQGNMAERWDDSLVFPWYVNLNACFLVREAHAIARENCSALCTSATACLGSIKRSQ